MNNTFEDLRTAILKMDVVTVGAACQLTNLSREAVLDFVSADRSLRIFDEVNGV